MEYPLVYIFKKNKFLKITIIVIIFIRSKVTNNTEKRKHLTCINTKTKKVSCSHFDFILNNIHGGTYLHFCVSKNNKVYSSFIFLFRFPLLFRNSSIYIQKRSIIRI